MGSIWSKAPTEIKSENELNQWLIGTAMPPIDLNNPIYNLKDTPDEIYSKIQQLIEGTSFNSSRICTMLPHQLLPYSKTSLEEFGFLCYVGFYDSRSLSTTLHEISLTSEIEPIQNRYLAIVKLYEDLFSTQPRSAEYSTLFQPIYQLHSTIYRSLKHKIAPAVSNSACPIDDSSEESTVPKDNDQNPEESTVPKDNDENSVIPEVNGENPEECGEDQHNTEISEEQNIEVQEDQEEIVYSSPEVSHQDLSNFEVSNFKVSNFENEIGEQSTMTQTGEKGEK